MKIQLSVTENYCDSWGLYEAVREFFQNGRDATRAGCTLDASYRDGVLKIVTKGTVLTRKTLAIGDSSKRGRADMIGQHGEGYKIGSLVLLRLGKGVKIRTGTEVWVPEIAYSRQFGQRVISFEITGGKVERNEVVVEISGVSQEEWDSMKDRFLFLDEHPFEVVETPCGGVILDGGGKIYVDGIYVCKLEEFVHGYNLFPADAKLDRDRRMMNSWDSQHLTAKVWEYLYMNEFEKYGEAVNMMLAENKNDTEHFRYEYIVSHEARKRVAEQFIGKFGSDAVPVSSESQQRELEFLGRKGVVVPADALRTILEAQVGTLEVVRSKLAKEIAKEYSAVELTPKEAKNLLIAREFIRLAGETPPDVELVDFRDPRICGMRSDGKVLLSRHVLSSASETIKTMVEEVAHDSGADGTHSFAERMHSIYAAGVVKLMTKEPAVNEETGKIEEVIYPR